MDLTVLAVSGVLVVVVVGVLAPRLAPAMGAAVPLLLVAAGIGLSYLPGVPRADLDPEIVLAGVLPPLLYAASVQMPAMDFRRDFKSISGLSVVVVVVSAVLCGVVFDWVIPGIGLAEGIALGAVISPTDAVATSIVRSTGVAPRLVTTLEGESMLNDASALVLLRSAVAAFFTSVALWHVALDFVLAVVVAVVVGAAVGLVSISVRAKVRDASINTAISFVVPFVAYVPAERLHGSGLVAVVVTGLLTGYWGPAVLRAQDRLAEAVNWRTIAFLLEGAVFLLMGLELPPLVDDFRQGGESYGRLALAVALGCVVLLVVRALYVGLLLLSQRGDLQDHATTRPRLDQFREYLSSAEGQRLSVRRAERIRQQVERREADMDFYEAERFTRRDGVVLVWAGMRGSITVAAAQSLPSNTPERPLLVLAAFAVALVTLILQGGTLGWVVRRLGAERDRSAVRVDQLRRLQDTLAEVAESRCAEIEANGLDGDPVEDVVMREVREQSRPDRNTAWAGPDPQRAERIEEFRRVRRLVLEDQRHALMEARGTGRYDSSSLDEMLRRVDAGDFFVRAIE